ncbi:hypothetical protein ACGF12_32370 [Kitasatospora sp. NPDC048296]|uniref:hypothetical protein n=1 Tax=Kitasatospora sp. NPDC048296 TaxID=3364048 RepID=UPI0037111B26
MSKRLRKPRGARRFGAVVAILVAALMSTAIPGWAQESRAAEPRVFYVDADGGNDANCGLSPDDAWKTLGKVSAAALQPGDTVKFKAGDTFPGQLKLTKSGTPDQPIKITHYGTGTRPVIKADSNDATGAAVLLENVEGYEISSLEITFRDPETPVVRTDTPEDEAADLTARKLRQGVEVVVDNVATNATPEDRTFRHIYLNNLYIHDIDGQYGRDGDSNETKGNGGVGFVIDKSLGTDGTPARFDDIQLTNSRIEHVDQTGVWLDGIHPNGLRPEAGSTLNGMSWENVQFTNVQINNNEISDTAKNAAILRMMQGGTFSDNNVHDTSDRVGAGNSIMTSFVNGVDVEFNEVSHNNAWETGDGSFKDGAAFDPDLDSPNTIWRNNYSHDNHYGLVTLCTRSTDDGIVIANNIDVAGRGRTVNLNYSFKGVAIEENAFWAKPVPEVEYPDTHPNYVNPDRTQTGGAPQLIWETFLRTEPEFTSGQTYTFKNNSYYNEAPDAVFYLNPNDSTSQQMANRDYSGNHFWGILPAQNTVPDGAEDAYNQVMSGFTYQGDTAPADMSWIGDTVGDTAWNYWQPVLNGGEQADNGPQTDLTDVKDPTDIA